MVAAQCKNHSYTGHGHQNGENVVLVICMVVDATESSLTADFLRFLQTRVNRFFTE